MKWKVKNGDESEISKIANDNQISELAATLLKNRGYEKPEDIQRFLDPKLEYLEDPYKFENMKKAVSKILEHKNEKIFIYGDYDMDGISATAFLVLILKQLEIDVDYYIPSRLSKGYGLTKSDIKNLENRGANLIITVDIGVNSKEDTEFAKSKNIDIIVVDHHRGSNSENGIEIELNPKTSKTYPFKELSGSGVTLKLAEGLYKYLKKPLGDIYKYLDIVMLGMISDVVPMVGENRVIIKKGLKYLKKSEVKGFKYLLKYLKLYKTLNTNDISFNIVPLFNALGRITDPEIGVSFFLEKDEFAIYNIIEEMKKANYIRRQKEKIIYDDIEKRYKNELETQEFFYLYDEDWYSSVIGIVASKLSIKYDIPVFLISVQNNIIKGSCRSPGKINLYKLLERYSDCFIRFGGHSYAVGFTMIKKNIKLFENIIKEEIKTDLKNIDKEENYIDKSLELSKIDIGILKTLKKVSPFGNGNEQAIFKAKGVRFRKIKKFGVRNNHFKGEVKKGGKKLFAICFNMTKQLSKYELEKNQYEILYYPEEKRYNNKIQINIKNLKKMRRTN
ncbi:MAG: single-stranded-DNA-specific exonuclease RecJ [Fusobacteriota bacterium]